MNRKSNRYGIEIVNETEELEQWNNKDVSPRSPLDRTLVKDTLQSESYNIKADLTEKKNRFTNNSLKVDYNNKFQ